MNKIQMMFQLPEPAPHIELVRYRNEDGDNYDVVHHRAFNIDDQTVNMICEMQDWFVHEMIMMDEMGITQEEREAQAAWEIEVAEKMGWL